MSCPPTINGSRESPFQISSSKKMESLNLQYPQLGEEHQQELLEAKKAAGKRELIINSSRLRNDFKSV